MPEDKEKDKKSFSVPIISIGGPLPDEVLGVAKELSELAGDIVPELCDNIPISDDENEGEEDKNLRTALSITEFVVKDILNAANKLQDAVNTFLSKDPKAEAEKGDILRLALSAKFASHCIGNTADLLDDMGSLFDTVISYLLISDHSITNEELLNKENLD